MRIYKNNTFSLQFSEIDKFFKIFTHNWSCICKHNFTF